MSFLKRKNARREALTPLHDPHLDMAARASAAVAQTVLAEHEAIRHAEDAERYLGAIRREVAVTQKARRTDQ